MDQAGILSASMATLKHIEENNSKDSRSPKTHCQHVYKLSISDKMLEKINQNHKS